MMDMMLGMFCIDFAGNDGAKVGRRLNELFPGKDEGPPPPKTETAKTVKVKTEKPKAEKAKDDKATAKVVQKTKTEEKPKVTSEPEPEKKEEPKTEAPTKTKWPVSSRDERVRKLATDVRAFP